MHSSSHASMWWRYCRALTIAVRSPEPVIAHMASYRAWADQHAVPFEETVERARDIVSEHIERNGVFKIGCLGGMLVCTG